MHDILMIINYCIIYLCRFALKHSLEIEKVVLPIMQKCLVCKNVTWALHFFFFIKTECVSISLDLSG